MDQLASYTPPAAEASGPLWPTTYDHDFDGALKQVLLPDASTIMAAYEPSTGRLASVTTAHDTATLGYDAQGRVWSVTTPSESLSYEYDGFLPASETWAGAVPGTVGWGYDNDFRMGSQTVNGSTVAFAYDPDGVLTQAGALSITPEPATGRLAWS